MNRSDDEDRVGLLGDLLDEFVIAQRHRFEAVLTRVEDRSPTLTRRGRLGPEQHPCIGSLQIDISTEARTDIGLELFEWHAIRTALGRRGFALGTPEPVEAPPGRHRERAPVFA